MRIKRDLWYSKPSVAILVMALAGLAACGAPATSPSTAKLLQPQAAKRDQVYTWETPTDGEMAGTTADPENPQVALSAAVSLGSMSSTGWSDFNGAGGISATPGTAFVVAKGRLSISVDNGVPNSPIEGSCRNLSSCQWFKSATVDCVNHSAQASVVNQGRAYWASRLPISGNPAYGYDQCAPTPLTRSVPTGQSGGSNSEQYTITCTIYQDQQSWDGGQTWQDVGLPYEEC